MISKNISALMACLGLLTVLTGCEGEQSDKDKIMEAQYCLDEATAGSANACLSSISGLTSSQAYALRCAAGFIDAGVTSTANLSAALTAIQKENTAGTSTLLAALSFSNGVDADQTASYCNSSKQPGMALMGAMAKSATLLNTIALPSCSGDPDPLGCASDAMSTALTALVNDFDPNTGTFGDPDNATLAQDVAGSIQTVYSITCSGTNTASSDICGPINDALSAAGIPDITAVSPSELIKLGGQLLTQWQGN
ncbi:MAG: hypothetical protein J7501_04760 [Bdellovibrio sp.]|nr:hypothetical protein [Bdellovibrio sp.]